MFRLRRISPRARHVLWLVLVNIVIFLTLVVVTNILSGALLALSRYPTVKAQVHNVLGIGRAPLSNNANLAPYAGDEKRAKAIWEELERSRDVVFAPFVEWKRPPFEGKWVTVSASGDRIYRPPTEPPANAPVIRFFGGSAMWGTGVEDSKTIPAIYARRHPGYRVLNHGEAAFNSRQNLERLINLLTQRQRTDVAVFYEGFNDVLGLCRTGVDLNGHNEEVAMRRILSEGHSLGEVFYGQTVQLLRRLVVSRTKGYLCAWNPARARQVAETALNVWRLARTLQQASCGRLVVVLQPVAVIGQPRVDYIGLERYPEAGKELRAVYPYWQAAAKRPENRWLHNLTRAYDGNRPLYIDLVHVAQGGNEIMARRMGPLVERALADARSDAKRCRAQG